MPATADETATDLAEIARRAVIPRLCRSLIGADRLGPRATSVIAPHLNTLHVSALAVAPAGGNTLPAGRIDQVGALTDALLADDVEGICARIDAIRACGRSLERIYLDLLMPAAAQLDHLLAQDLRGCAEITVAFLNLGSVLRRFAADFQREAGCLDTGSSALLAAPPAPGGTAGLQMFSLLFAAEFFRREGWGACTERSLSSAAFRDAVETRWFDVVAVFASRDEDLDEIAAGIKLIRRGAPNRDVGIVACGRVFDERPEITWRVGADHRAPDLLASLSMAKKCLLRRSERRLLS